MPHSRYQMFPVSLQWNTKDLYQCRKITAAQLLKKCQTFYAILQFITVCTWARHLSLCWGRQTQSILSHSFSLMLNNSPIDTWVFHLVSYLQFSRIQFCMQFSTRVTGVTCPVHLWCNHPIISGEECKLLSSSLCNFSSLLLLPP